MSEPTGEMAARQSLVETVLEALPEIILIHDHDRILFANAACRRFLSATSPQELEGRPIDVIAHPDAFEAGRERRQLLIDGGRSFKAIPLKLIAVDGETKHMTVDAHPLAFNGTRAAMLIAQARPN